MGMGESSYPKATDNQTVANPQGPIIMGFDGSEAQAVLTDIDGKLQVAAEITGGEVGLATITDPFAHTSVSVTTSSTQIIATVGGSFTRYSLIINNISDTTIWLKFDFNPAIVGEGYELLPGEKFVRDIPAVVPQIEVVGIHAGSGSKTVLVSACDA